MLKLIVFCLLFPILYPIFNSVLFVKFTITCFGNLIVSSIIIWAFVCWIFENTKHFVFKSVKPEKKIVLITGCDSGFGYLTAKKLNENGFTVFATCLFPEGEGAEKLRREVKYPEKLFIVGCDVTKDEDIDKVYKEVSEQILRGFKLWAVVNNAGIVAPGETEFGTFQHEFEDVFKVNCFGVVKVTRKFLPFIRRSKGRVVIIGSVAGRFAGNMGVSYFMSKAAVAAFSDGLRLSMSRFGVPVILIEPGAFQTEIINKASNLLHTWQETNTDVRNDYGESHINKQINFTKATIKSTASNEPARVSDTIFNEIVSPYPNLRQVVGSVGFRFVGFLIPMLPTDIAFFLFNMLQRSM